MGGVIKAVRLFAVSIYSQREVWQLCPYICALLVDASWQSWWDSPNQRWVTAYLVFPFLLPLYCCRYSLAVPSETQFVNYGPRGRIWNSSRRDEPRRGEERNWTRANDRVRAWLFSHASLDWRTSWLQSARFVAPNAFLLETILSWLGTFLMCSLFSFFRQEESLKAVCRVLEREWRSRGGLENARWAINNKVCDLNWVHVSSFIWAIFGSFFSVRYWWSIMVRFRKLSVIIEDKPFVNHDCKVR